jgi:hypothetical protein
MQSMKQTAVLALLLSALAFAVEPKKTDPPAKPEKKDAERRPQARTGVRVVRPSVIYIAPAPR